MAVTSSGDAGVNGVLKSPTISPQALAGAVHNVSTARTPVLIYAGASPYTQDGELKGSRNEFIHAIQK